MLQEFDAREVVIQYNKKGDRADQVLQNIVLDHVNRLEQQTHLKNLALLQVIDACYGVETTEEIATVARAGLEDAGMLLTIIEKISALELENAQLAAENRELRAALEVIKEDEASNMEGYETTSYTTAHTTLAKYYRECICCGSEYHINDSTSAYKQIYCTQDCEDVSAGADYAVEAGEPCHYLKDDMSNL